MSIRLVFESPDHKKDGKQSLLKKHFDKEAFLCGSNKINIVTQNNLFKVRLMCLSDQYQLTVSSLLNVTEAHKLCHGAVFETNVFPKGQCTHTKGSTCYIKLNTLTKQHTNCMWKSSAG